MLKSKLIIISDAIGVKRSRVSIVTSILVTIITITSVYNISSFFDPDVYFFEQRVTYHTNKVIDLMLDHRLNSFILSSSLVLWLLFSVSHKRERIFLVLMVVLISVLSIDSEGLTSYLFTFIALPLIGTLYALKKTNKHNVLVPDTSSLFANYLCTAVIALAIISILYSLNIVGGVFGGDFFDYSYLLVTIISRFSPIIIFLLVFSVPFKLIWEELSSRFNSVLHSYILNLTSVNVSRRLKILSIGSIILLSIGITLIPHIPNRVDDPIGVDTIQYSNIVNRISDSDMNFADLFWLLFKEYSYGDRPLSILFIYGVVSSFNSQSNTGDTIEIVLPMILAPSLSIVVFLLTREITRNEIVAILSGFLTAISPQILIGLYAGFYANWLALIIAYLSLTFMFGFFRTSNMRFALLFFTTLVAVIFLHSYTYTVFIVVLAVFLIATLFLKSAPKNLVIVMISLLVISFLVDLSKSAIIGTSSGITLDLGAAEKADVGISQFAARWSNLVRTILVHVGGIFGNSIFMISLAFIGMMIINRKRNMVLVCFLLSFLSIGILPLFFGDKVVMTRILYNVPFQIPASLALIWIMRHNNVGLLATTGLLSYSAAISIRLLTNF